MRDDLCALLSTRSRRRRTRRRDHRGRPRVHRGGRLQGGRTRRRRSDEPARRCSSRTTPGEALRAMSKPVICAVNGACVSGGLEIALSSTFIVASERARFADTHARLGRGRDLGPHRAAAAGGRDPQGDRDVDHRQLRRRRRGAAHRPRQPRRGPRRPAARHRAARRRGRHDRRGRRRCCASTAAAKTCRWPTRSRSKPSTPGTAPSIPPRSAPRARPPQTSERPRPRYFVMPKRSSPKARMALPRMNL